jgi:hypothetical protein
MSAAHREANEFITAILLSSLSLQAAAAEFKLSSAADINPKDLDQCPGVQWLRCTGANVLPALSWSGHRYAEHALTVMTPINIGSGWWHCGYQHSRQCQ